MNSLSGDDDLAARCFGLCQALVSQNRSFSLALTVGSFSFSLDTRELASNNQKAEKKMKKKKPSPSTIRRSVRRKEEFLKKKALTPPARTPSDSSGKKEPGFVLPVQPKESGSTPLSRPPRILPSPSPSSGRRRVTSCAGRLEVPAVLNPALSLDGESSLPPPTPSHHAPSSEAEVDVGECDRDNVTRFCEIYPVPPKSVRSSISKLGRGFFVEIDKKTANFVYEFENGELYEF